MRCGMIILLLGLLCSCVSCSSRNWELPPERDVLLEVKSSFSDPHGLLSGWDPYGGAHHCSWLGVACDPALRVISLNLSGCDGLQGNPFRPCSASPLSGCVLGRLGRRRFGCGAGRRLGGELSPWVGRLRELRVLWLPFNDLGGEVPLELWRLEKLQVVNLEGNSFTGRLLAGAGSHFRGLCRLRVMNLGFNKLHGVIPVGLSQCVDLEVFNLAGNNLKGGIPQFIFGFVKLRVLYLADNEFSGRVPGVFGRECHYLEHLDLSGNRLVGSIPDSLGHCWRLKSLLLYSNMFTGVIPRKLGQLRRLEVLDVSMNFLGGKIPAELGKCINLSVLVLSNVFEMWPMERNASTKVEAGLSRVAYGEHNRFHGSIPREITSIPDLRVLWAPRASLGGKLPSNWGECRSLEMVNLAQNEFSGEIAGLLVGCKRLQYLDLSSNRLTGKLDKKLPVPCMTFVDVSSNLLSGFIPRFNQCGSSQVTSSTSDAVQLSRWGRKGGARIGSLAAIGISSNRVSSPLTSRILVDTTDKVQSDGHRGFTPIEIASIVSASSVVFALLVIAALVFCSRKRIPHGRIQVSEPKEITTFVEIGVPLSYESIVRSTGNFNGSHQIGSGGFGATYKAEVSPGNLVAVKRLATGRLQGVEQFHAEIKALGRVKHHNLVTLIGYHASETEMFLIYNYLAGGNLADFIKERSARAGNWKIVHKIALDIASALAYLHDECSPRVLHRDVKPSNILLDGDCNAYLSDFGLSRLLGTSETHVTTGVAGTFGYVAPEYALTSRVSEKSDVYSYGVVLLELLSDKRALDPSFSAHENGFNIVSWASMLLQHGKAKEVFTPGLWETGPHDDLVNLLHLAVTCTVETRSLRPNMKHVVRRLKQIRPN